MSKIYAVYDSKEELKMVGTAKEVSKYLEYPNRVFST